MSPVRRTTAAHFLRLKWWENGPAWCGADGRVGAEELATRSRTDQRALAALLRQSSGGRPVATLPFRTNLGAVHAPRRSVGLVDCTTPPFIQPGSACPALLIRGAKGGVLSAEQAAQMAARRPGTRLVELGTDHFLYANDPVGFANAVRDFLASA